VTPNKGLDLKGHSLWFAPSHSLTLNLRWLQMFGVQRRFSMAHPTPMMGSFLATIKYPGRFA
jgi:hypothetical protein